jgi:hypothetical protein
VKAPAQSQFLSLAATLDFVKDQTEARSTFESAVWRPVYRALVEGQLCAIGDFEDRDGKVVFKDKAVLHEDWRALSENDFHEACYRSRVLQLPDTERVEGGPLFLINVRIAANDLRSWRSLDAASALPTTSTLSTFDRDTSTNVGLSKRYPGRPSIKPAIVEKLRCRAAAGLLCDTVAAEARWLHEWAGRTWPGEPGLPSTPQVIENQIRDEYRNLHRSR